MAPPSHDDPTSAAAGVDGPDGANAKPASAAAVTGLSQTAAVPEGRRSLGHPSPAWARALQRKVSEAAYLTAQNHERYRPIMRFFYERHMAHHYSLTLPDILDMMRTAGQPAYTEEQCEQDLAQLCEWGNLVAEQDRSRARTVEEFLRRRLRYSITAYGVAFERLLTELEQGTGTGGSLDPSLLDLLAERLELLGGALAEWAAQTKQQPDAGTQASDASRLRAIHNLWNQAFETFDKIGEQASDYLGALYRGQQDDLSDVEVFLAYKEVLLQYLNSFVTSLFDVGDRIAQLLRRQVASCLPPLLIEALVAYESRHLPAPDGTLPDEREVRERRTFQWHTLAQWFQPRGGLETLRRRTTAAIERVVRQSQRVMDRRSGLSRRRELEALAALFAEAPSVHDAHRLAGAAWGCVIPRHITGSAEVFTLAPSGSVWAQQAHSVPLTAVRPGTPHARRRSAAVPVQEEEQRRAVHDEWRRRQQEETVWGTLFQSGELDLGALVLTDPGQRARLLAILGRCLASPDRTALAPDGSTIRLLPPAPDAPAAGLMEAPDGALALPRFRLRRIPPHRTPDADALQPVALSIDAAEGVGRS